jgi:hypothetical protein
VKNKVSKINYNYLMIISVLICMDYLKAKDSKLKQIISLPIIFSVIIPIIIFDIWIEIYHRTCFPLYKIKYIKRKKYIKIDRHKLQYLKWYEKIGCAYCGYANGVVQYSSKIAAESEKYWCGIMHKKGSKFLPLEHHKLFLEYGDEKGFKKKYNR